MPAIALALPQASILARVMRSSLLDTLDEDYIRSARAKGLSRGQTLWRHALRNALIPVLTIIGLQFSFLLAGAIIIENVFFLPGLGRLVFQGITSARPDRRQIGGDAAGLRGDPRHLPRRPHLCDRRPAAAAGGAMTTIATPVRTDSLLRAALRSPNLLIGATITLIFVALALLSFVWTPYDFVAQNIPNKLKPPSAEHWLGTDHFGRDVFSMIMVGARTSIAVAFVAVDGRHGDRRAARAVRGRQARHGCSTRSSCAATTWSSPSRRC